MSKKQLSGAISFSSEEQSLIKRAVICRTGFFNGMYGEVNVTKKMLEKIADKYLADKENPTNENDYAPILKDHERKVDNTVGRILAKGMTVEPWKEIDGEMQFGLFADLNIIDEEAKKKVLSGLYAHVSISFDEDTGELYEMSFVPVEAARGSIVLSHKENPKGGSTMSKKRVALLSARNTALRSVAGEGLKKRKAALEKMLSNAVSLEAELVELQKKSNEIALTIKCGQIKGKFNSFIKGGKMNPSELKAIDVKALASLDEKSFGLVLGAYESRPVSSDVFQHGQVSNKSVSLDMSPKAMRKAMELQKAGKGVVLSEEDKKEEKEEKKLAEGEDDKKEEKEHEGMSHEDLKSCLEDMAAHHAKLAECIGKIKEMSESMKDVKEEDEQEHNKLAESEEEDKKLAEGEDDKEGEE